jgi:hypothetical protein
VLGCGPLLLQVDNSLRTISVIVITTSCFDTHMDKQTYLQLRADVCSQLHGFTQRARQSGLHLGPCDYDRVHSSF